MNQHHNKNNCHGSAESKKDYLFFILMLGAAALYLGHLINLSYEIFAPRYAHLFHSFYELMNTMSWGIFLGIVFVGLLGRIPREYIISILGRGGSLSSIVRATGAGILLDLCSHGILMVGMKLYERGASTGQVMAFLIASPWNSFSLTIILFTLIGPKWTLLFIFLSALIAVISGLIFNLLEEKKILPANPNTISIPDNFDLFQNLKNDLKTYKFQIKDFYKLVKDGLRDSKMILKWIVLGAILSSLVQSFVPLELFKHYFGPTLMGLSATLFVTTIMEVCSEGSTPLAADLLQRAKAPGNSFTFLMAGVSTDYTEILSIKSTTSSLKVALFLPLVTVPQVLILGYILNQI